MTDRLPVNKIHPPSASKEAILVASGDLRLSANQTCWPTQEKMEKKIIAAFAAEGIKVKRGHPYDPVEKHGFISSQRMGMDIFKHIPVDAPVIVAESVWQYSHHVLAGLHDHQGPILTVANWEGEWPGLVGLLNLNACLAKMGVKYSTIWSKNFDDEFFLKGIRQWIKTGEITHDASHVRDLDPARIPADAIHLGQALAQELKREKAILGIFDEGCMGMYNAIIEDDLLNNIGVYKERLSQSALVARMNTVKDADAQAALDWVLAQGMKFVFGKDGATELTVQQVLTQMKMYVAAVRIAHDFGCNAVGIQYQQGLKDMVPASDLVEGLLNDTNRPPVFDEKTGQELFAGRAVVHFNEVDEGAGLDALITNRIWTALALDPATTLHDIRYGEHFSGEGIDDFVWVFEISGAVPPSHLLNGYAGAVGLRQPAMYFPYGGSSIKGVSHPGEVVWSRIYVVDGQLHADLGRATSVTLPQAEVERRWAITSPEWPMMNAVIHGVSRDQMMARHKANHINVVYAPSGEVADRALAIKAAMLAELGITVHLCGSVSL